MLDSAGRFAPSPSGDLHIGNVRTGILAYLWARGTGRGFRWRIEDLDRVSPGAAERQLEEFRALGLEIDGPIVRQTQRIEHYAAACARLDEQGLVYECYCSRKDIQSAPSAPHAPPGAYPGTCRDLAEDERIAARARLERAGRAPALRLRTTTAQRPVVDEVLGTLTAHIDDVVLRRGDGVWAYNLAVVVDDAAMGIDQVVRGDDLASSAPRQALLCDLLGLPVPAYAHVPLVLNPAGARLAKRDGAVTLEQLRAQRFDVWAWMGESLGFGRWMDLDDALASFDPAGIRREATVFDPPPLTPAETEPPANRR
ncbi:glutamyl-tRNA synthetase [Brevibacterium sp. Mu109]|uniref:tRNA glutamyl-Q(34) synthetase GluQRS n=1 Tax=Brevibacterium sp. Mu109 TaxID=1255669 RepID=UPI000C4136DD|nr:tRNA glutamyl-Q(34) synthetase GluQRS [Brevibacterium sp. Mu109]SMX68941.1 glutamyl-tRNA synthetase [Brevibacterium sp. Mu109]